MLHTKKRSEASLSDDYKTPRDLYLHLCIEYNVEPKLDVCANAGNKQCNRYVDEFANALAEDYDWRWDSWCNPPHSKTGAFVKKAYEQWRKYNMQKHQIPSPPAPTPKPQKPTKVPEVAEPKEPALPDIPKSIEAMKQKLDELEKGISRLTKKQ